MTQTSTRLDTADTAASPGAKAPGGAAKVRRTDVLVVGGGIGGLAAARGLRASGMSVTLLEQAPEFGEVGAGLQLGPNATRLLRDWGLLERVIAVGVEPANLVFRDAVSGEELTRQDLQGDFARRYGAPYVVAHRSDLHTIMVDAAAEIGVNLITSAKVSDITATPSGARVVTADGSAFEADLVLGADGLTSTLRPAVSGDDPVSSGYVAYRGTFPMADVELAGRIVPVRPRPDRDLRLQQGSGFGVAAPAQRHLRPVRGQPAIHRRRRHRDQQPRRRVRNDQLLEAPQPRHQLLHDRRQALARRGTQHRPAKRQCHHHIRPVPRRGAARGDGRASASTPASVPYGHGCGATPSWRTTRPESCLSRPCPRAYTASRSFWSPHVAGQSSVPSIRAYRPQPSQPGRPAPTRAFLDESTRHVDTRQSTEVVCVRTNADAADVIRLALRDPNGPYTDGGEIPAGMTPEERYSSGI